MCGANVGLCLPRSSVATSVASRPRIAPSASITCHSRLMSLRLGVYVGTGRPALSSLLVGRESAPRRPVRGAERNVRVYVSLPGQRQSDASLARMTDAPAIEPRPPRDRRRAPGSAPMRRSRCCSTPSLEPIVDMVLTRRDGAYEALSADGRVRFTLRCRRRHGARGGGRQPDRRTRRPTPSARSRPSSPTSTRTAATTPTRTPTSRSCSSSTPPRPPTSACCTPRATTGRTRAATSASTARSAWCRPGRRGSSRARASPTSASCPAPARLVDVAPTIASLLGCAPLARRRPLPQPPGRRRARRRARSRRERPRHVVGFLFDGANPNVLYAMAARGRGAERRAAHRDGHRVRARRDGRPAHRHARQPHVDPHRRVPRSPRHPQQRVVRPRDAASRSSPTRRPRGTSRWTHHARAPTRSTPRCCARGPTSSPRRCNEPCDVDAPYSTFGFFRRGENPRIPQSPDGLPHTTERFVRPSKDYSWSSIVDHMAIEQAVGIWAGHYRDESYPLPALHVGQLHAHRRRDARVRAALGDGRGVGPRQRRPHRRGARRGRAGRRVRRHRVRARRRPRHGGERPARARATGTSPLARGRPARSATRPTASCTSA